MTLVEEGSLRYQLQHRVGEQCHDHDVDEGRDPEREREALHVADGNDVEDRGREEVDGVGGEDGAYGTTPARLDRRLERSPVAQLVAYSLEVDDERVRCDADGDDEARDARQRQPHAVALAEEQHDQVGDRRRDHERRDGDGCQRAVLQHRVQHDQDEADQAGEQAGLQLRGAEGRRDRVVRLHFEADRQRTVLELVGEGLRGGLGE